MVLCATGLASVAARRGRTERASRLFGATKALREKRGVAVSWSYWRNLNERDLRRVRERFGREAFEVEWTRGKAMTLEETAAEALAQGAWLAHTDGLLARSPELLYGSCACSEDATSGRGRYA